MDRQKIEDFCKENSIELLVLFGSHADGRVHTASDVDLAVKMKLGVAFSKLGLIYGFSGLFEGKDIDLVVLTIDTGPVLLNEIFSRGRPLYEGRAGAFEEEKLRAWKLYLDTEKLRTMQREYLKRFAEKLGNVS